MANLLAQQRESKGTNLLKGHVPAPAMTDEDSRAFYERFMAGMPKGTKTNTVGELAYKKLIRTDTPDEMLALAMLQQEVGTGQEGLWESAGIITGQVSEMVVEELPKAMAVGTAAGVASGIGASTVGTPLAGVPVGLATATAVTAAAMPALMAHRMYQQEAGSAFLELSRITDADGKPLSREITAPLAHMVGAINGLLEIVSLGVATKPFKNLVARSIGTSAKNILKSKAKTKAVLDGVKQYGYSYLTEVLTEGLQKDTNLIGAYAGKSIQEGAPAKYTSKNLQSDVNSTLEEMKQAAKGMWFISGAGSSVQMIQGIADARQQEIAQKVEKRLRARGATDGEVATAKKNMTPLEQEAWLSDDTAKREQVYEIAKNKAQAGEELTAEDEAVIEERYGEYIAETAGEQAAGAAQQVEAMETAEQQVERGTKTIYHGTAEIFDDFDIEKSADGTIWFTDNKEKIEKGEVSATGKGQIMERIIDENSLKLGGWEETDKYSTDELIGLGYDGLKLEDEGETTYQIFFPEKLQIAEKAQQAIHLVSISALQDAVRTPAAKALAEEVQVSPGDVKIRYETTEDADKGLYITTIGVKEDVKKKGIGTGAVLNAIAENPDNKILTFSHPFTADMDKFVESLVRKKILIPVGGTLDRFEITEKAVALSKKIERKDGGFLVPLTTETVPRETVKAAPTIAAEPVDFEADRTQTIDKIRTDKKIRKEVKYDLVEGARKAKDEGALAKIKERIAIEGKTAKKRTELQEVIIGRKFEKVENLRKAMKLSPITKMSLAELNKLDEALKPFHRSDVFLTERQIETVDNTDLKGIRTQREAMDALAGELNVPREDLGNIKVGWADRLRHDTALARKNPFYGLLVEELHRSTLEAEAAFLAREETINDLTRKARASRKRSLLDRLIPTDKMVFDWLDSDNKAELAKKMTPEELGLAEFIEGEFAEALEYLIKSEALGPKGARKDYITHIRRDFFEAWKDDGVVAATKEALNEMKLDEQTFDILDQKTGEILPLQKFFRFAMRRTGGLEPSQNVAKAVNTYFKTFETKRALDSFMPKMMIYVDALTPKNLTKRGLEMDTRLRTFVKEWINTKKGRPAKLIVKPGSKTDILMKAAKTFVTTMDLGFNIPVGVAATVGETVANFVNLGNRATAKGAYRLTTKKGRKIVSEHKEFIGKSVWSELLEPSKNLKDKTATAMFGMFTESSRQANKVFLLGSITKQEFESGIISSKRLAKIKIEMGKYRVITGGKSILGTSTLGGYGTQYKSWAIPILTTTASNIRKLTKAVYSKKGRQELTGKEMRELGRQIEVSAAALIMLSMLPDDDDDSFIGQLSSKVKREALTILGALDPSLWTSARMLQWAKQWGDVISELVMLEKYKAGEHKGGLKAPVKAARLVTPRAVKSIMGGDKKKKKAKTIF
jgi:hypothetical protein